MKISLSRDASTGNFWIDMGLVVLLERFGEGEYDIQEVLSWLMEKLRNGKGWRYPASLFINLQAKPENLPRSLSKNAQICDMCGRSGRIINAKMWMFPFLVDPQKFANFYPGVKRGLKLCSRCALAGLAGYLGWLWKAQGRDAFHFFIFHTDLEELRRLYREVLRPLVKDEKGGNAPIAFSGPYIHETTLGLLLALFAHVRQSNRLSEEGRRHLAALLGALPGKPPFPLTLYAITGSPGRAFNMHALREFNKLQQLYRLYELWIETLLQKQIDPNPHRRLTLILGQFEAQRDRNRESIWRDRIARAVMEFDDPLPFVEDFLFDVRAREKDPRPLVRGTLDVFNQYMKEVFAMDEKFQRMLAGFGHTLGETAQGHNEMGLLYALRNAKNPEDFYRVLNDIQFRLNLTVPEELLKIEKGERIAGVPWRRVKTLLSIYAMNSYLRKDASQKGEQTETKEG
ncbi:hypothetical protein DRP77_10280 [Candidatus Poribacteria bacterium]|nr:MAG: hypothetical protein DRP77_10280 [Candidatus Poribacteria bacterium]